MLIIQVSTLGYKKAFKLKDRYLLIDGTDDELYFDLIYDKDEKIIYGKNDKFRSDFQFDIEGIRKYLNQSVKVIYTDLLTDINTAKIGKLTDAYSDGYLHLEIDFRNTFKQ